MGRRGGVACALVAAVLAAGCSGPVSADRVSPPPAITDSPETPRVLLAGDSITVGYYATTEADSFAATLLAGSGAQGVRAEEAGARTWRIARLVEELPDPAWDVAVLEAGANDVGKTPLGEYARDYRRLVEAAERGSPNLVVCLGPWNDGVRTAAYDRRVRRICTGDGRVFTSLSDLYDRPELRGPAGSQTYLGVRDGFHPNDAGHAAIARRITDTVGSGG